MSVSVLLIGASGALGKPLLAELIRQKSSFLRIAVLAANEEKATKFAGAKTEGIDIIVGSFLDASSYAGITHVICAVGNALMRLQPAMIEAAVQAGVTHFYPSEWNSDISQKEIYDMRYFRDKQMTRSHLAATAKEHPDFQYTLFVTGIFTEWSVLEFYGFDHEAATAEIYGRPDARVGVTSIPDIAHYTISSLLLLPSSTHPSSARTIRVGGSSQPFSTLIETLSRVRGREYTVTYLDAAAAAAKQEEARVAGDEVGETVWSIKPLLAGGHGVADGRGETLDNGLFDFVPETLEETFERIYAAGAD